MRKIFLAFSSIFVMSYIGLELYEIEKNKTRVEKINIKVEEENIPILMQKSDEYIMIKRDDKFGYVDKNGKIVINPVWDNISIFDNYGYARTIKNKKMGLIDKSGNSKLPNIYDDILTKGKNEFIVTENGKKNILKNKKKILKEGHDELEAITDHFYIIGNKNQKNEIKLGLIYIGESNNTKNIYEEKYDNVIKIAEKTLLCKIGSEIKIMILDDTEKNFKVNEIDIVNKYDKLNYIDSNLMIVEKDKKVGVIDYKETEIVSFGKYDKINDFLNRHSVIKLGNKYGLINTEGKEIISPKYEYLKISNNDNKLIFKKNGRYGIIDFNEKIIVEPIYKELTDYYGNRVMYTSNDKVGIIDEKGKLIEEVLIVSEIRDNVVIGGNDEGFTVINADKKKIIKVMWSDVTFWGSKYIKMKEKGTVKIIDYEGRKLFLGREQDITGEYYDQLNLGNELYLFDDNTLERRRIKNEKNIN